MKNKRIDTLKWYVNAYQTWGQLLTVQITKGSHRKYIKSSISKRKTNNPNGTEKNEQKS